MTERTLVEFRVSFLEPGYETHVSKDQELLEGSFVLGVNRKISTLDLVDVFEKVETKRSVGWELEVAEERWHLKEPIVEISVVGYISENPFQSGLQWEVDNMSEADVFEDYLEDIVKLARPAKELLEKKRARDLGTGLYRPCLGESEFEKTVSLVTLWNWNSYYQQTMDGDEYDTDWELIGSVNLYAIDSAVTKLEGPIS